MSSTHSFYGYLGLVGEPLDLLVDLRFEGGKVEIRTSHDSLGCWPVAEVEFSQLEDGVFSMLVGNEKVRFVADDPPRFAREAIPPLSIDVDQAILNLSPKKRPGRGRHLRPSVAPEQILLDSPRLA